MKFQATEIEETHYNLGVEHVKTEIQELTGGQAKFV